MNTIKQKDAVFMAVCAVKGKEFFDEKVELNKDEMSLVVRMVAEGLNDGTVSLKDDSRAKYDTLEKLQKQYVPGLVRNWLKKDTALNGGVKHEKEDKILNSLIAYRQQAFTQEIIQKLDFLIQARKDTLSSRVENDLVDYIKDAV